MKKQFFASVVCLASAIGNSVALAAQERPEIPLAQTIDGSTDPEKIPFSKKMRAFLSVYDPVSRSEVASALSASDMSILDGLKGSDTADSVAAYQRYVDRMTTLCADTQTQSAVKIASDYEHAAQAFEDEEGERYEAVLSELSPDGQGLIRSYIADRVTPGLKIGMGNSVEVAEIDPEVFLFNFDLICHLTIHGRLPEGAIEKPYEHTGETGLSAIEVLPE